ncbi:hypothetical protein Tco_0426215, partial [Tanacetum coccineum]
SDEELEAPMEDQPLPADASPTALSLGYIANFDPEEDEEDPEEDPADHLVDGGDNDDNESSDDDDDDDDVVKDEEGLERVESIAYKLKLPQELSRVHNTFHISNLKRCCSDDPLAIPLEGLHIDDKFPLVEEPVVIMDRDIKRLKSKPLLLVIEQLAAMSGMDLKMGLKTVIISHYWYQRPGYREQGQNLNYNHISFSAIKVLHATAFQNKTTSSPNRSTFDIEDAFPL